MRHAVVFLTAGLLAWGAPANADIFPGEEPEEGIGVTLNPVRAGRLEVIPILSVGISDGSVVYQGGVSVGYSLSRLHQIGGAFVAGQSGGRSLGRTKGNNRDAAGACANHGRIPRNGRRRIWLVGFRLLPAQYSAEGGQAHVAILEADLAGKISGDGRV